MQEKFWLIRFSSRSVYCIVLVQLSLSGARLSDLHQSGKKCTRLQRGAKNAPKCTNWNLNAAEIRREYCSWSPLSLVQLSLFVVRLSDLHQSGGKQQEKMQTGSRKVHKIRTSKGLLETLIPWVGGWLGYENFCKDLLKPYWGSMCTRGQRLKAANTLVIKKHHTELRSLVRWYGRIYPSVLNFTVQCGPVELTLYGLISTSALNLTVQLMH